MIDIRKKSQKQEERTVKELGKHLKGGRVQAGSGALWGNKGDARFDNFLVENKFTDADSYSLQLKIWNKIEREAVRDGLRHPMIQIDIQDAKLIVVDYNFAKFALHIEDKDNLFFGTRNKSYVIDDFVLSLLETGAVVTIDFQTENKLLTLIDYVEFQHLLDALDENLL